MCTWNLHTALMELSWSHACPHCPKCLNHSPGRLSVSQSPSVPLAVGNASVLLLEVQIALRGNT